MKISYDYLNDPSFLKQLATFPIKEYYFKIILLDWKENPLTEIQGKAINSNINIDGQSSMRRTGNISVILDDLTNKLSHPENLFSINKKIFLEIGFLNNTLKYKQYQMLWFPLGVFVVTGCSISHSTDNLVASLNLKDKMCLLNGECGGVIPASVVLDNYETINEKGDWVITKPTIYQIIKQLVNHFGKEDLNKIIISDLNTKVKQVVKWSAIVPLYFVSNNQGEYRIVLDKQDIGIGADSFQDIPGSPFEFGEDVGFIYTDFTYPGDLIGNAGTNVAALLEQIKNTLGNYEFFYDIQGNFIFRQIKNFLNTSQSFYNNLFLKQSYEYSKESKDNEERKKSGIDLPVPDYIDTKMESTYLNYLKIPILETSPFNIDNTMIISCNNTPQYQSIKNDFVIWGIRQDATGKQYPIRYHLAIDKKPQIGNIYYDIFEYEDPQDKIKKWHKPLFFDKKADFPEFGTVGIFYAVKKDKIYQWNTENLDYQELNVKLKNIKVTDWRTELYLQGVAAEPYGIESNYYYTELLNEWPKIYDVEAGAFREQVINNPSLIDFYLDIIDSDSLSEISVQNIGRRTQVFNEGKNVNCIFEPWIPDEVFIKMNQFTTEKIRKECERNGQNYIQIDSDIYDAFQIGGYLNSAYEVIKQSIQTYVNYNNNISIQTLPLYCLQPNTRITVNDPDSDVYGDFVINSMSFSIDVNSMLTINATKIFEKI